MTETSDMALNLLSIEPATLTIAPDGNMLVQLWPDGRLEYGPNYTPDAAAKCFWEAMAFHMPISHPPTDSRDGALEEAARVADEHDSAPYGHSDPIARKFFHIGEREAAKDIGEAIRALKSPTPPEPLVTDERGPYDMALLEAVCKKIYSATRFTPDETWKSVWAWHTDPENCAKAGCEWSILGNARSIIALFSTTPQILVTDEAVERAARAMCEDWYYAPIGTPDGDGEWRRKQGQYRRQARAALQAALTPQSQGADGWQPIETAPKDGTLILGYNKPFGRHIVYWGCHPQHNPNHFWIAAACQINHIDQPTHWQPLPKPPVSENPQPQGEK